MRSFRLTTRAQILGAGSIAAVFGWCAVSTGALVISGFAGQPAAAAAPVARPIVQARTVPVANPWVRTEQLARSVETRHEALLSVLSNLREEPGAAEALAPGELDGPARMTPDQRLQRVRADQERLLTAAERFADTRAETVRGAFRAAGLNPGRAARGGVGGPFIALNEAAGDAARDGDLTFAQRLSRLASRLTEMRRLTEAAENTPFGVPVENVRRTSGFGGRSDPFNGSAAFHSGLDFAGPHRTPILATADGTVSYVGQRSGYGNVVEIDHGRGLKTRYAHLSSAAVRPGQSVQLGQRIAAMGNTGRSTGTHLHYEVLVDERPANPDRFLRAGERAGLGG